MDYYPVFLDLRGRSCLVVGTGWLADQRAAVLEKAGAVVTREASFEESKATDCWLITAVTEDPAEAERLRAYANRNRIFLNVLDQTAFCSFIAPAIVERENLLIAISTSGKCPALATRIREELEGKYGPEYGEVVRALGDLRPQVKKRFRSFEDRKAFYYRVLDMNLVQILKETGPGGLTQALHRALGE